MTEKIPRNIYVEGLLELGRNWALAVAIASAGTAAQYSETVIGPQDWQQYFAAACIMFSLAWLFLAGFRFWEVVNAWMSGRPGKLPKITGVLVYVVLVLAAVFILAAVKEFAINARIIKICESGYALPDSKIPEHQECKRLSEQRKDFSDRMEDRGKYATPSP